MLQDSRSWAGLRNYLRDQPLNIIYRLACLPVYRLQTTEPTCNSSIWSIFYDYQSLFLGHIAASNASLVHCQSLSPQNFRSDDLFIFYYV